MPLGKPRQQSPLPAAKTEGERQERKAEAQARAQKVELRRQQEEPKPKPEKEIGGIEFVYIPPGEFLMGSPDDDEYATNDEKPQHKVRITQGFYMGKYPLTQAQYEAVMGENPSFFKGEDRPVERVSWKDVVAFCEQLSLDTGEEVRLPTEAEWEYACRAGSTKRYCFGDSERLLSNYAWFENNSDDETHPVGQKRPNAWGLYDVHGNAWEWCYDWDGEDYYANSPRDDPEGPSSGEARVLRGGSWFFFPDLCRAACRLNFDPTYYFNYYLGVRVVVCARAPS